MDKLTAQYLVDIIKTEMDLNSQNIWIRDQNKVIPNTRELYIAVGFVNISNVLSNVTYMKAETVIVDGEPVTTQHQINEVQQLENIQIDIFSRSNEALQRSWEVIAAMQSIYSQQVQEKSNFKIFRIPDNFLNTSIAEGGSTLNRYTITVRCMVWYRKDKLLASPLGDYYDDFNTRVDDAITIETAEPLIEFEINSEGIVT